LTLFRKTTPVLPAARRALLLLLEVSSLANSFTFPLRGHALVAKTHEAEPGSENESGGQGMHEDMPEPPRLECVPAGHG
jgi:hypothetical protein